ncbi:helix-turn-helix domain-containing protein [Amycolatopsis nigrescens]|uniref:helix-turn-helix domain-containing protein n=1 Tax=Amycolatopsis nigrescens TaxID=381445 RepID=UPI00035ECD19|nr:helix-turn-helix domain-containing protein [Amycolatopsis nigrescens]
MSSAKKKSLADLLHQPVRWRITQALIGRELTTAALAEQLPDVPHTTLYRHVGVLVGAGVLVVVAERKIRGTVERTYRLNVDTADDGRDGVDPDQLRTMFTVFVAGIAGDFDRYLERADIDPVRDGIAFRQAALWLDDNEFGEFLTRFGELLARYGEHEPGRGRTRRILSTILMPDS